VNGIGIWIGTVDCASLGLLLLRRLWAICLPNGWPVNLFALSQPKRTSATNGKHGSPLWLSATPTPYLCPFQNRSDLNGVLHMRTQTYYILHLESTNRTDSALKFYLDLVATLSAFQHCVLVKICFR